MLGLAALVSLVASCAAGDARFDGENLAGFWYGLWHGLIAWIALVVGLFDDGVEIYERANTGAWYDVGFLLGLACMGGSGRHSHRRWKEKAGKIPAGTANVNVDVKWTPAESHDVDGDDSDERGG